MSSCVADVSQKELSKGTGTVPLFMFQLFGQLDSEARDLCLEKWKVKRGPTTSCLNKECVGEWGSPKKEPTRDSRKLNLKIVLHSVNVQTGEGL